jgi:hypothetical protein
MDSKKVDRHGKTAAQIHSNDLVIHYLVYGSFPESSPPNSIASSSVESSKFIPKPYIPPANPTYLPPKSLNNIPETDEAKLIASRERTLSKMKSKESPEIPGKRWDCHGFANSNENVPDEAEIVKSSVGVVDKPLVVGKLNVKDNWIKNSEDERNHYKGENDAAELTTSNRTNPVTKRAVSIPS